MCPPMRAHWCHLVNTVELEHPSAHFSPQPKRENDRFSHFCTAYGRNSLQWATYSPELPILMGDLDPQHIIPWGHVSPKHKGHVDRLGSFCTVDCRMSVYFTMVRPFLPQNCPFPRGIWSPCNTWFLGPIRVLNPNGNSIASVVIAGLTSVTD